MSLPLAVFEVKLGPSTKAVVIASNHDEAIAVLGWDPDKVESVLVGEANRHEREPRIVMQR